MRRWLLVVAGYHHPGFGPATARDRWTAHVPLIPVFPLLGVVLWALVRDERGPLRWPVVVAGLLLRRAGVGAVLLVGAAVPFQTSHIFWPVGVSAMVASAAGAALLEWSRSRPACEAGHASRRLAA